MQLGSINTLDQFLKVQKWALHWSCLCMHIEKNWYYCLNNVDLDLLYVFVCESYAHKSMGLWSNNIFLGGFLYLIQMLVKTYSLFGLKILMDVQGSSTELC